MDDLTRIKGIGPAVAKRLAEAGIETFAQLAAIEDDEDSRADQLGVKSAWIAEAAKLVAEQQDTQGKPPRPHDGSEDSAEAPALPADSGAGDPQQDNPRGSSGTAREAPGTGGGTTAETPSVGIQSGSPNHSSDAAPIAGVSDAPLVVAHRDEPASLPAWLDFEALGDIEQRRRFPLTIAALRAWAVSIGSADRVAAGPVIRIAAKRDGFRRAGLSHPKSPVEHMAERFTPDQVEQLLGEPALRVEFV